MVSATTARAAAAVLFASLATAGGAEAHSTGIVALGCDGCHRGGKIPTVTLLADKMNAAVGEPITLTLGISQANGTTAGFYLTTGFDAPGTFKTIEAGTALTSSGVIHTTPRAGSGGTTTFKIQWTASQPTGVAFDVFALSANGDKRNQGDGAAEGHLELIVGCAATTYYVDQDSDGYGTTDPAYRTRTDCKQPPGYAPKTGDCDDFRSSVHPGATEQCDLRDNDCNGSVDEAVVDQTYCVDEDGDGHGVLGGATKVDCKPSAGFGDCAGDCDDHDATVFPGAPELCDKRDNDCNGAVDEIPPQKCGVGLCARVATSCDVPCRPGPPVTETCDGYDDDCNDLVDEGDNDSLCGNPNIPCINGQCMRSNGAAGSTGAGAGASGTAGSSSSVGSGLSSSPPSAGCALGGPHNDGWAGLAALALVVWRRRRTSRFSS